MGSWVVRRSKWASEQRGPPCPLPARGTSLGSRSWPGRQSYLPVGHVSWAFWCLWLPSDFRTGAAKPGDLSEFGDFPREWDLTRWRETQGHDTTSHLWRADPAHHCQFCNTVNPSGCCPSVAFITVTTELLPPHSLLLLRAVLRLPETAASWVTDSGAASSPTPMLSRPSHCVTCTLTHPHFSSRSWCPLNKLYNHTAMS